MGFCCAKEGEGTNIEKKSSSKVKCDEFYPDENEIQNLANKVES
jgi:hypothetical protein